MRQYNKNTFIYNKLCNSNVIVVLMDEIYICRLRFIHTFRFTLYSTYTKYNRLQIKYEDIDTIKENVYY